MKKLVFKIVGLILLTTNITANEIQVFTSNTMHIDITPQTKFEEVYCGPIADFYANSNTILQKEFVQNAAISSGFYASGAIVNANTNPNMNGNMGDALQGGAIGALAGWAIVKGVEWVIADNEYLYVSIATNNKGEKTMLFTLIVANNSIDNDKVKKLGLKSQNNL